MRIRFIVAAHREFAIVAWIVAFVPPVSLVVTDISWTACFRHEWRFVVLAFVAFATPVMVRSCLLSWLSCIFLSRFLGFSEALGCCFGGRDGYTPVSACFRGFCGFTRPRFLPVVICFGLSGAFSWFVSGFFLPRLLVVLACFLVLSGLLICRLSRLRCACGLASYPEEPVAVCVRLGLVLVVSLGLSFADGNPSFVAVRFAAFAWFVALGGCFCLASWASVRLYRPVSVPRAEVEACLEFLLAFCLCLLGGLDVLVCGCYRCDGCGCDYGYF